MHRCGILGRGGHARYAGDLLVVRMVVPAADARHRGRDGRYRGGRCGRRRVRDGRRCGGRGADFDLRRGEQARRGQVARLERLHVPLGCPVTFAIAVTITVPLHVAVTFPSAGETETEVRKGETLAGCP